MRHINTNENILFMIPTSTNYLRETENYATLRFIFEMFAITLLMKIMLIPLYVIPLLMDIDVSFIFGHLEDESNTSIILGDTHWPLGFVFFCIAIPIFETIVSQAIPIYLMLFVIKNRFIIILISAILFALLHESLPIAQLLVVFGAGMVYGWSFMVYKEQGFLKAVFVTSAIHGLFNFVAFFSHYFLPDL